VGHVDSRVQGEEKWVANEKKFEFLHSTNCKLLRKIKGNLIIVIFLI
jgi:hypothetical protein